VSRKVSWEVFSAVALAAFFVPCFSWAQYGDIRRVHDPTIIHQDGVYYLFSTGKGIPIRRSEDMHRWKSVGNVFESFPPWTQREVAGTRSLWAPDISFFAGRYHLYYSVSTFGKNRSCIGLATNATLDQEDEAYQWIDHGKVIESHEGDDFNAIDPHLALDERGQPWLAFGSFWSGIKVCPLDRQTGKLPSTERNNRPKLHSLAARPERHAIEAPFILRRDGFYYLFVSFDRCCQGTRSTYQIMVGRSPSLTGPYRDKEGRAMMDGGGSLVLTGKGHCRGPGHNDVLQEGNASAEMKYWLVHHYYDARERGMAKLQIRPLAWAPDGWPIAREAIAEEPDGERHQQ